MGALDSLWKKNLQELEPSWPAVFNEGGNTMSILPLVGLGDDGLPTAASFITRQIHANGIEATFTWSKAPSTFDTPFDPTDPANWEGIVPVVQYDGVDEKADTPDNAYWSVASNPYSVGVWFNAIDATNAYLLAKYDATTGSQKREWMFYIDSSDYPSFQIYDESSDAHIVRQQQTALPENQWHFMVGTWDGSNLVGGIKVYLNGVQVDDANVTGGSFTAQEDLAGTVTLAHSVAAGGGVFNPFEGKMAGGPFGPFFTQVELTAAQVKNLYVLGRAAMGLK